MSVGSRTSGLTRRHVIVASGVSVALHLAKVPPAIPVLQHELQISLLQVGFLLSSIQIAGMLLGLTVGLNADRMGLRRSVIVGLLLISVASFLGAAMDRVSGLLVSRMFEGLGLLLVAMPAPALIKRNVDQKDVETSMGWWAGYIPLGTAIGVCLGPWVLAEASWRQLWIALGAISAAMAVSVATIIPSDPPRKELASKRDGSRKRLSMTLDSRGPWLVGICFMAYSSQWIGIIGFLPAIYARAGLDAKFAGLLTALVALANMGGNVVAGKLLKCGLKPQICLRAGFLLMGLGATAAFIQSIDTDPFGLWIRFFAIVGFSGVGGLIPGTLFASMINVAPSDDTISTTVGFSQQWSSFGQFIGPPLIGGLAAMAGGWQLTWIFSGCASLFGWWIAKRLQLELNLRTKSVMSRSEKA